ncbi:MAG TPA: hypothetical protein VN285_05930 [Candidatus Deferrimicrobium sp.]|nr:hypothetical protein [Candidatus Deferrimicrobium sp.]
MSIGTKKRILSTILLVIVGCTMVACTAIRRQFAPKFEETGVHVGAQQMTEAQCLSCHKEGINGAPKAPSAMLTRTNCVRCHLR